MTHTHSIVHHSRRRFVESRAPRLIGVAVAALLAIPGMARAQAPAEPAPAFVQAPVRDENLPGAKSPGKALALSLVSTGLGVALMAATDGDDVGAVGGVGALLAFVGPNVGHLYAGDNTTAATQIGVRAGASGAAIVGGIWYLFSSCSLGLFGEPGGCDAPPPGAAALMIGGAVVSGASTVYSIYDAPRAARRTNAKIRARQLMLTPAPVAGPDGTSGLGMHVTGRF
jgi:hypothetical protein